MKGIILAGGKGTRLQPTTYYINKHLLNVYDKPMFYYPIKILMLLGIKDILIVSNSKTIELIKKNFKYNKKKIKLSFVEQKKNNGITGAIKKSLNFIKKSKKNVYILGDNFFSGKNFINKLKKKLQKPGATIFVKKVSNPRQYGVLKISKDEILSVYEKPKKFKSQLAITGLYFFDDKVSKYCKKVSKSLRGELEITSIINLYAQNNSLKYEILDKKTIWYDMGTPNDLLAASIYQSKQKK